MLGKTWTATDYLFAESAAFEAVEEYVRRIFKAPEHLTILPGVGKPCRMPDTKEWLVKIRLTR